MSSPPDTVDVTVGPTQLGVVVTLGESRVAISLPTPSGVVQLSEAQMRATALRLARRALTVAQVEPEIAGQVA